MNKIYGLTTICMLISSFLMAQSAEQTNSGNSGEDYYGSMSIEFNIGSMRPTGLYADNLPNAGMLDLSSEFQMSLRRIFAKDRSYFPLSLGMKIGYNYYSLIKDKSGDLLYDTTGLISLYKYEFKYTLRAHAINFHPFLEISTPFDRKLIAFARGYWGPSYSWVTSKFRNISEDNTGAVQNDKTRDYSVKRWTMDYGYKIGVGIKLRYSFLTFSYTQLWGGEVEYLGKESVKSYDPMDPSQVEIEPVKSTTDRYLLQVGFRFLL